MEWQAGEDDLTSYAFSIAPPEHWELTDCIAIVSQAHKPTGSSEGHALAGTSPLQAARLADTPRRLDWCRRAILDRDFEAFAKVVELDCLMMHAVMITSNPSLIYWQPGTLAVLQSVLDWRENGLPICYTIDAGPNVHVISPTASAEQVISSLAQIPGVEKVLAARPGGPAHLV